jgi:outer membrane protein assembly factor BamE (lipoprotein component of BamABCDE complex)
MPLNKRVFGYEMTFLSKTAMAMVVASIAVSGCTSMQIGDTMYNGYVVDQQSLDLMPVGSSREQVLLALGTPVHDGDLRQRGVLLHLPETRRRRGGFHEAQARSTRRILAVYFDEEGRRRHAAPITAMKDGKVFDFDHPHDADRRPRPHLPRSDAVGHRQYRCQHSEKHHGRRAVVNPACLPQRQIRKSPRSLAGFSVRGELYQP